MTRDDELMVELLDRALCSERLDDYLAVLEAVRQVIERLGPATRWSR